MKYVSDIPGKAPRKNSTTYDSALANELLRHRGKWAVVRSGPRNSVASTASIINSGAKPALPPNRFEAAARDDGTGWKLYVRAKPVHGDGLICSTLPGKSRG